MRIAPMAKRIWNLPAVLVFFLLATFLNGQTFYGGISGRVIDSGGSAVPGASLTITDQATGASRSTKTSDQGE